MPRPTPKLEDHPLSGVRDCLLSLFVATLHIRGCFSICNLRTCHAVVAGTHKHGSTLPYISKISSAASSILYNFSHFTKTCLSTLTLGKKLLLYLPLPIFHTPTTPISAFCFPFSYVFCSSEIVVLLLCGGYVF